MASSKRRLVRACFVVGALLAAGIGLAAQAAGWWANSDHPVVDPEIVTRAVGKPNPDEGKPDLKDALSVAGDRTSEASLIAVPQAEGGYCISISPVSDTDLPVTCVDKTQVEHGNVFVSWAIRKQGQAPLWAVGGRVTQRGASAISTLALTVPVNNGGFFFSIVPERRWNALSRAQGRISILDVGGNELLARANGHSL